MLRVILQLKCIGVAGGTVAIWDHGPQAHCLCHGKVQFHLLQFKTELSHVKCRPVSSRRAVGGMLYPVTALLREVFSEHSFSL